MSGILSLRTSVWRAPLVCVAVLALGACQDGQLNLPFLGEGGAADAPSITQTTGATEERDVEAPEVFSATDQGLWDGRPSLGGVWVAHPDVVDPERVIIRNEANGSFVIGALFRRERENPGPLLQVSSDAAEELGMLAGAPATLSVVALRREAAPVTPPIAPIETDFDTAETVDPAAPTEVLSSALDPVDGSVADPAPLGAPLDASSDPLIAAAAAIEAAEASAAPAATPAPTPTSSLSRPYIQIGIFSVEANANTAAAQMVSAGLNATVVSQTSQGRAFWRVIVGPATTEASRAAALDQVKALGFTDAYFVTD